MTNLKTIKHIIVIGEQVILYSAIVAGIGFYFGTQYQANQQKTTEKAVSAAVGALKTPQVLANVQASK